MLPDGREFEGAVELGQILADDPELPRCFVRQLFTYALGRGVEPYDQCALEDLEAAFVDADLHIQDLIVELVQSPQFTMRRAEVVE